jgi:hypothetical protein
MAVLVMRSHLRALLRYSCGKHMDCIEVGFVATLTVTHPRGG